MKIVIESGYFNPLHTGHLDMIEAGEKISDKLIVIVNNDKQQLLKKGKVILTEDDRARVVAALRNIDEVVVSIDDDPTVIKTLEMIAKKYPNDELIFANGGDRSSAKEVPETAVCEKYGIKMLFGIGGEDKVDSSTRINQELGREDKA